jgi:hypothetical protein
LQPSGLWARLWKWLLAIGYWLLAIGSAPSSELLAPGYFTAALDITR